MNRIRDLPMDHMQPRALQWKGVFPLGEVRVGGILVLGLCAGPGGIVVSL